MPRLKFYYVDISGFHGSGFAVWLNGDNHCVVQNSTGDESQIYRFSLMAKDADEANQIISNGASGNMAVKDRDREPDEVRVYFGIQETSGKTKQFQVWDRYWDAQPDQLKLFKKLAEKLVSRTKNLKPKQVLPIEPGKLKAEWPNDFDRPTSGPFAGAGAIHAKSKSRKMKTSISREQAIEIARKRASDDRPEMFNKPYVDSVERQSDTGNWVVKILSAKPKSDVLGEMYLYVIVDKESGAVLSMDAGGGS